MALRASNLGKFLLVHTLTTAPIVVTAQAQSIADPNLQYWPKTYTFDSSQAIASVKYSGAPYHGKQRAHSKL